MTDRPTLSPETPREREPVGGPQPDSTSSGKPYQRRKFRDWEVIACLIFQGVDVRCYRTGEKITMENVHLLQKEHLVELGLIEPEKRFMFDVPGYCRYSLAAAHAVITDGSPATSAGSSKHRIAKMKRCAKETDLHKAVMAGEATRTASRLRSRGFDKTKSRRFNGKVVPRE